MGPIGYSGPGSFSITQNNVKSITATEIGYLDGVVSNIQDQLDGLGNSVADYVPLSVVGFADGVAQLDSDGNLILPASPAGAGIKFRDNTIQTTAFNSSGFATSNQLSDVEALALAGLYEKHDT
jgi:hypothetical protein